MLRSPRCLLSAACALTAVAQLSDESVLLQISAARHGDDVPLWYPFRQDEVGEVLVMNPQASVSHRTRCREVTPMLGTMKSPNKLQAVVDVMTSLHKEAVPGDVVEAGVAEGGGILPILFYMGCTGDLVNRTFHLFDTWEGLPEATDGKDKGFATGDYHRAFSEFMANVKKYAEAYQVSVAGQKFETGTPIPTWNEVWSHVNIVKGLFADTMPGTLAKTSVALLCCDGDMYVSTKDCFDAAGPRLSSGATVYNDDYYTFSGCYQATREFIDHRKSLGLGVSSVQIVSQYDGFRYFNEETSNCIPPQNNGAGDGRCNGVLTEGAVFTVY